MAQGSLGRHADFNRLWAGQTVSNFGDKISLLALPTIALVLLDGGAFEAGMLGALRFLPFVLLAPFAGLLADRIPRRKIMIAADLGRLIALASIPVAFITDSLTMGHLFVVAGVVGVLTAFFEVAYQSWLPALIGTEHLVEGNTKLQVSRSLAEVLGAGTGGLLMHALGAAKAVVLDAVTFLVSVISLLAMKEKDIRQHDGERESAADELKDGIRTLVGTPVLRGLLVSNTVVNFGAAMGDALLLVYAYKRLGLSPGQVGAAAAAGGVAVIAGAVLSGKVAELLTLGRTLVLTAVALGAGYALLPSVGATAAFAGLIVIQVFIGFASPIFDIHVLSLVQGVTPQELTGRVSGAALAVVWGALSLGYAVGGALGEAVGVTGGLVTAGAVTAVGGLSILAGPVRAIREMPAPPDAAAHGQPSAVAVAEA